VDRSENCMPILAQNAKIYLEVGDEGYSLDLALVQDSHHQYLLEDLDQIKVSSENLP